MCKKGNGSFFKECSSLILKWNGGKGMSNKDMRNVLRKHGGCLNGASPSPQKIPLDKSLNV